MQMGKEMKECYVTIQIPYKNKEDLHNLFKAEEFLRKVGLKFDTGAWVEERIREWDFDWSLEGAKVIFMQMKNGDSGKLTEGE